MEVGGQRHAPSNSAGSHGTVAWVDVEKFPYPHRRSNPKPSSLFWVVNSPSPNLSRSPNRIRNGCGVDEKRNENTDLFKSRFLSERLIKFSFELSLFIYLCYNIERT